jgi:hypothetical protein
VFFLLPETLKSRTYADGSPRVVSSSPHVPVELPNAESSRRGTEALALRVRRIAASQLQEGR